MHALPLLAAALFISNLIAIPIMNKINKDKTPLVLISWDGESKPLSSLLIDAVPNFDILIFDYSGRNKNVEHLAVEEIIAQVLSMATECKGDIYQALAKYIISNESAPCYIGLIDDDIVLSISDINRALHLANLKNLDVFSPTLTHDSNYSHSWMLQRPHRCVRDVEWVEVMMPFYKHQIFIAASAYFDGFSTSWGFDAYLFPMIQREMGMTRCALIDSVAAFHYRPISSHQKVYRSGMTAFEEAAAMKKKCMDHIADHHPDWLSTEWYRRIYIRKRVHTRFQKYIYQIGRPIKRWLENSG